jgi:hypothetical protein
LRSIARRGRCRISPHANQSYGEPGRPRPRRQLQDRSARQHANAHARKAATARPNPRRKAPPRARETNSLTYEGCWGAADGAHSSNALALFSEETGGRGNQSPASPHKTLYSDQAEPFPRGPLRRKACNDEREQEWTVHNRCSTKRDRRAARSRIRSPSPPNLSSGNVLATRRSASRARSDFVRRNVRELAQILP